MPEDSNLKQEKHPGGRPPLFSTPEELQIKIDEYFTKYDGITIAKDQDGNVLTDSKNRPVFELKPPTIAGLALYLGFLNRHSIYDYEKRNDEFSHIIKRAVLKVEEFAESQLYGGKPVGSIFWLKNHKWQDKTEIEASVNLIVNQKIANEKADGSTENT